ncbi:MAG: DUF3570 domain-containing protein [Granulosicoccus sp.]
MASSLRKSLASATCALLAAPCAQAENPHEIGDWDVSSAFLFYREPDRVQALEPVISATRSLDTDESISFKLTLDTLTGASGSGAVPSKVPQTFTRPSGVGSYVTPVNTHPLDDTFKDTRVALAATWTRPSFWGTESELGFNVSNEYDYLSLGASASFAKSLSENNTTFSTGFAVASDTIEPVGGAPIAFARMQAPGETQSRESESKDKTMFDVIAGFTQVVDVNSLFQLNYAVSASDGYLNDPYKVVSIVDPVTGAPVFDSAQQPDLPNVVFENRPDARTKHSVYGQYKRYLQGSGDILDTSYRFMLDDWGIRSHTLELKYRKTLPQRRFLQPRIRLYQQGAADFYTPFFLSGTEPGAGEDSQYASADYRLGDFTGYTLGMEYGRVNQRNSWSIGVEYYLQSGSEPAGKIGDLLELELYPDVDALMFRLLYDF